MRENIAGDEERTKEYRNRALAAASAIVMIAIVLLGLAFMYMSRSSWLMAIFCFLVAVILFWWARYVWRGRYVRQFKAKAEDAHSNY